MPKVLAFRHVPFEHLGLIAESFERKRVEFEYADLAAGRAPALAPSDADGLVFMGGPMSVNDGQAWIADEIRHAREAIDRGVPVLGICLGAQIMAKALGASVYPNAVKEIGWMPVYWTAAAARDALFGGLSQPETLFHWHGEMFDLPAGAELLASSDACRNQAFRMGHNAYALQFHLEVTPGMIAGWCEEDANCADVRELDRPIDPHANAARLAELASMVFDGWCGLLG